MKYSEFTLVQVAAEWQEVCLDYEKLKQILYGSQSQQTGFFDACAKELEKVNAFFVDKIAESQKIYSKLENIQKVKVHGKGAVVSNSAWFWGAVGGYLWGLAPTSPIKREAPMNTVAQLKSAYLEFHYELYHLKQFQQVNMEGFRKIIKKRDKVRNATDGNVWKARTVDSTELAKSSEVDQLMTKVESAVIILFGGDRNHANRKLRVLESSEREEEAYGTCWWLGFGFGCFLIFFSASIVSACLSSSGFWQPPWVILRVYRCGFVLFWTIFLYGVVVRVWARARINHVLILELDPRLYLTREMVYSITAGFIALWSLSVLGYLHLPLPGILELSRLHSPLVLAGIGFVWLCNPFDCLRRSTRAWLLLFACRYIASPFVSISFADFWFAEQITSMVPVMLDGFYTICLYSQQVQNMSIQVKHDDDWRAWGVNWKTGADLCSSGAFWPRPLLASVPFVVIIIQCFRRYCADRKRQHLLNAAKYASTFPILIFSSMMVFDEHRHYLLWNRPYVYLWALSCLINVVSNFIWDIRKDWELCVNGCGKLRPNLAYEKAWYYYAAIVAEFVLRINWIFVLSSGVFLLFTPDVAEVSFAEVSLAEISVTLTALLECLRRFIWNIFYLENEHFENVRKRRAVRKDMILEIIDNEENSMQAKREFYKKKKKM